MAHHLSIVADLDRKGNASATRQECFKAIDEVCEMFERVTLFNILIMMIRCVYETNHMYALLWIENTSESDPHSYEATKAVEL